MISKELEKYLEEKLPTCNSKLELAYAIYILLGQALYYSPIYANTKRKDTVIHPSKVTLDNPFVICYTWSEIYKAALEKYEINAHVDNRNKEHSYVIIDADDIKVTADATKSLFNTVFDLSNDLTSIKFGLDINFFSLDPEQNNINDKRKRFLEMRKTIHQKLKITSQDEDIEKYIKMLDECDMDLEEKTILLINLLNTLYKQNNGEIERRQLFDRYYKKIFSDENYENRIISILYNDIIIAKKLIIVVHEESIIYYLEDEEGFRVSSREEINRLLLNGTIRFKYSDDEAFYKKVVQNSKCLMKK